MEKAATKKRKASFMYHVGCYPLFSRELTIVGVLSILIFSFLEVCPSDSGIFAIVPVDVIGSDV